MTVILAGFFYGTLLVVLAGNLAYLSRRGRAGSEVYPALSVLIPARNEAENLRRLLPSLLGQAYPDVEIIVYDDDSSDETPDVLARAWTQPGGERLVLIRGDGPPEGWVGKVHALYQATRVARGGVYLFLDADAWLPDPRSLQRLVRFYQGMPEHSILTGFTRLRGGGLLLVSLIPMTILSLLPWPLVRRTRSRKLGALNGQCWMIAAEAYARFDPHAAHQNEILEDVEIGRYLKAKGLTPVMVDVRREVHVFMYRNLADAWRGLRKNAYLLLGGSPLPALTLISLFAFVFVVAPVLEPWFFVPVFILKGITDRYSRFPVWLTITAPLAFLLATTLLVDSMIAHLLGRVTWKGRPVGAPGSARS